MTLTRAQKTHEQRIRRMAARQGLGLSRSRTRDPVALDYGTYELAWLYRNVQVLDGATLDEVESWLRAGHGRELVAREKAGRENAVMVRANTAERDPE